MPTITEATDIALKAFNDAWTPTGHAVVYPGRAKSGSDPAPTRQNEPWAHVMVTPASKRIRDLVHTRGGYSRYEASLVVMIHTPADGRGTYELNTLVDRVIAHFDGASFGSGSTVSTIKFYDMLPADLGVKGRWNRFLLTMNFYYFNRVQ